MGLNLKEWTGYGDCSAVIRLSDSEYGARVLFALTNLKIVLAVISTSMVCLFFFFLKLYYYYLNCK